MISKNKIKLLRSLRLKKYREQNKKTILEGARLIDEAINASAQIDSVFATKEILHANQNLAEKIQSHHIHQIEVVYPVVKQDLILKEY